MITFYSTHCPKCNVLSKKMQNAGLQFQTIDDVGIMLSKGIKSAPYIELEDGTLMDFMQANNWLKTR